jgi:hypothetical protein
MTKKQLKELIKETISEGFFDDMDSASAKRQQKLQSNPPLVYNITTKKMGNSLNVSLTINDYDALQYPNNNGQSVKLDGIVEKNIEDLIKNIADYNTRITKKV